MAVGALFRCRNAVIVGDPKQIEPVVTDDLKALKESICQDDMKEYDDELPPPMTSEMVSTIPK